MTSDRRNPDVQAMLIRMPKALHAAAKKRAEEEDLTLVQLVRRAIRQYLENERLVK
jgi:predicted HicB family RNase H-like nuclease